MRWQRLFPVVWATLLFSSCGNKAGKPEMAPNPFGPTGIPPDLRGNDNEPGTPIKAGGNASVPPSDYSAADLAWTNPDDADAEMPDLLELLSVAPQKGPWKESETDALRESKETGKPTLVWFTDSLRSAACKSLSTGLFTTSEFDAWASENVVRLIVDQAVMGKDMRDTDRKRIYVRGLKKKYNARGYPTLLVLSPSSGEVIGRYKSYRKGQEDFVFGQLKQGVMLSNESHKSWRSSMEKKGYRDWSGGRGRVIFAKLGAYKDGEVVLVEPDGQRARTHEKNLSAGDRVWIQQQKELRGIR